MEVFNKYILSGILLIVSYAITYFFRKIAIKKSILDLPNERSSHTIPTPRGGGLAIVITWYIGITFFLFCNKISTELYFAFLSGLILVIVSLTDDFINLSPIIRLFAQAASSALALYFLGGLQIIDFGIFKIESIWILTPIAFIAFIWFINLYNFLDGIDGYAALEAIFISISFFLFTHDFNLIILAVATLGFLIWNWQPAKIFMGDVGSTLLGFNFVVFAIYFQNSEKLSIIVILILTAVFWFDATLTLFRRWRNNEKLSVAHKKHAYQRIVQAGFSHQKTVFCSLIINVIGLIIVLITYHNILFLLFFFVIYLLFLYTIVKLIDKKKAFK